MASTPSASSRSTAARASSGSSAFCTPARRVDPLVHHGAEVALDQRRRLLPREVVEPGHPQVADLQHVAEALRADQPGARALALQQRVAGDGGAVHDLGDVGAVDGVLGDEGGDAFHDGPRVVVDAGGDLARRHRAILGQQNDIGEGAPDIDADAPGAHAPLSGALGGAPSRAFPGSGIGPRETAGGSDHPRAARSSARRASVAASSTCHRGPVDDDAVVVARGGLADQLVAEVAQHGLRLALQRVAVAARARKLVAEDVALAGWSR